MTKRGAALVAVVLLAGGTTAAGAQTIHTDSGPVVGSVEDGLAVFKGIPFAAPPVGNLRWRPPEPATKWKAPRDAKAFAPACEQTATANAVLGIPALPVSEDCLYLNIWGPAKPGGEKLPVMVWIYGGGFTAGSTAIPAYSGESLAKKGVIVVSIAYRLGAFGFLAHSTLSAESKGHGSGEYGMLDQIAGLKWVQKNIAAFGGDPHRVTIFGESAGGVSVSLLAASPVAKGLFQRAISESGGSFAAARSGDEGGENMPTLAAAEARGQTFIAGLGANTIEDARKLPAEALVKAAGPALGSFWPVADGYVVAGDPYRLYQTGQFNDVPVLIGTNADEGALFVREIKADAYQDSVKEHYDRYSDLILKAYPAGSDDQALRSDRDLFRDTAFGWPTWTWARLQSGVSKAKVFVYYFDHRPPYPDAPAFKNWGASHGAEISYVFGHFGPGMSWTENDHATSEAIQTYWTNFARTGDPNGKGVAEWPAFTNAKPDVLHITDTQQAGPVANLDQLKTLDRYYAWRRDPAQGGH